MLSYILMRRVILIKKTYSILSAIRFALMILPFAFPSSPNGFDLLTFILDINFYLPLIIGIAGIVLGILGVKGNVRMYLVLFNICGLSIYVFITFAAIFGFKEP